MTLSHILLDSLHPHGMRSSWWSPPFLYRGKLLRSSGICFVWQLCNVAEQGETPKGVVACLPISPHRSTHGGTISFLVAFAITADQEHQSGVYLLPSTQISEWRLVGCKYYKVSTWWKGRFLTSRSDCLGVHCKDFFNTHTIYFLASPCSMFKVIAAI